MATNDDCPIIEIKQEPVDDYSPVTIEAEGNDETIWQSINAEETTGSIEAEGTYITTEETSGGLSMQCDPDVEITEANNSAFEILSDEERNEDYTLVDCDDNPFPSTALSNYYVPVYNMNTTNSPPGVVNKGNKKQKMNEYRAPQHPTQDNESFVERYFDIKFIQETRTYKRYFCKCCHDRFDFADAATDHIIAGCYGGCAATDHTDCLRNQAAPDATTSSQTDRQQSSGSENGGGLDTE